MSIADHLFQWVCKWWIIQIIQSGRWWKPISLVMRSLALFTKHHLHAVNLKLVTEFSFTNMGVNSVNQLFSRKMEIFVRNHSALKLFLGHSRVSSFPFRPKIFQLFRIIAINCVSQQKIFTCSSLGNVYNFIDDDLRWFRVWYAQFDSLGILSNFGWTNFSNRLGELTRNTHRFVDTKRTLMDVKFFTHTIRKIIDLIRLTRLIYALSNNRRNRATRSYSLLRWN